ncbi:MAG: nucleotide exchange factor GrpE [Chloroflexi bacterium]|nr:nucleotide exchange factor GrpE [Chloroflexota bacterium]
MTDNENVESTPQGDEAAQQQGVAREEATPEQLLDEALREKEQFRALSQRVQADLTNYKRHVAEEQLESRKYATSSVLMKVLGVADDFQRGMENIPEGSVSASWLEGLKLVERNFENMLKSEGVTRIEAEGKPYDPREQEALFFVETDKIAPGNVVDIVRQGYRLHDRILRAAQVTVAKQPTQSEQPAAEPDRSEENA